MNMIPTVMIGGRAYEIPSLTTGQVKRDWPKFCEILASLQDRGPAGLGILASAQSDILLLALNNRFPEITMDDVDSLDLVDLNAAVQDLIEGVVRPKATAPTEMDLP